MWRIFFVLLLLSGCSGTVVERGIFHKETATTYDEVLWRGVEQQKTDTSCGAAAVTIILKGHYGLKVTEPEIYKRFLNWVKVEKGTEAQHRSVMDGAALEELFWFIKKEIKYEVWAYSKKEKDPWEKLSIATQFRPGIVYVEPLGYKHFAVLRGLRGDWVFLADPQRGNIKLRIDDFAKEWVNQWVLFIEDPKNKGSRDPLAVDDIDVERSWLPPNVRKEIFQERRSPN